MRLVWVVPVVGVFGSGCLATTSNRVGNGSELEPRGRAVGVDAGRGSEAQGADHRHRRADRDGEVVVLAVRGDLGLCRGVPGDVKEVELIDPFGTLVVAVEEELFVGGNEVVVDVEAGVDERNVTQPADPDTVGLSEEYTAPVIGLSFLGAALMGGGTGPFYLLAPAQPNRDINSSAIISYRRAVDAAANYNANK